MLNVIRPYWDDCMKYKLNFKRLYYFYFISIILSLRVDELDNLLDDFHNLFTTQEDINRELFKENNNLTIIVTNCDNVNELSTSNIVCDNLFINNETKSLINIENNNVDNNEYNEDSLLINNSKSVKYKDSNVKSIGNLKNKLLKNFRFEGNIGRLFKLNKNLVIKSVDYPFNKNNVFIIPNDLYKSLNSLSIQLLSSIRNNDYLNINNNILFEYLNNLIYYIQLNKDIQCNFIKLIQSNNNYNKYIKLLIDHYYFGYETSKLELYNIEFNNKLNHKLDEIFMLHGFNSDVLREYYVLNDYNYLNNKSKNNINLNIIYYINIFKL
jgi:hypothetical protein